MSIGTTDYGLDVNRKTIVDADQFGNNKKSSTIKVNAQLVEENINYLNKLLIEYKDVFAWTYKHLKGIPPKLAQHCIELDTSIPPTHQVKYIMNPNYVVTIRQDRQIVSTKIYPACRKSQLVIINCGSTQEEWKIQNLCRLRKLNAATQKNP